MIGRDVEQYKVVEGTTATELSVEVARSLEMGWVPYGPFTYCPGVYINYCQAMVKVRPV